ncbi:sodium:solute symporter family transporter [Candidatus Cardinium hertigii]|uniref:sodium:solute symporter family transporter n=1 Tax=Candidatus Cardinium hertigii TaxID=247481 RepID=UPI003D7F0E34
MPILIVGAFLLLTLVVGIYFSRQKTTFREYAVGNKQFATATLVATVLATYYGAGGLMRNPVCVYQFGLYWIILSLFVNSFSRWLFSRLMLRMGPFMQSLSNTEMMGNVYGTWPRIITALVGICSSICSITMQIVVMIQVISMCITPDLFNSRIISILATLVLIFYSMFGGVRAVTYTDVLQFLTFSIIIPLLAWFIFKQTGKSMVEVVDLLQTEKKFQWNSLLNSLCHFDIKSWGMWAMMLCIMVPDLGNPAIMQRVYMCSGSIQAKNVFSYVTFFGFCITGFILLIGILAFVGGGNTLLSKDVWDYIINNIPPTLRGILCITFLSMAMSIADSYLNACSVIVSNDILKIVQKREKITEVYQFKVARWTTLFVSLSSIFLTFYCKNLLDLLMLSFAFSLPVITAPLLLAIFGFRGTSRTALVGMGTGALAILTWKKWVTSTTGIDGSFVCMLANGLAMLTAHYLLKQPESAGWVKPDNVFRQIQQQNARKRTEQKEIIKNAWANKKYTLLQLITNDINIYLIGIYTITTAMLSYWFIRPNCIHATTCQVVLGAFFIVSKAFLGKVLPNWFISLVSLITLVVYLPLKVLENWWDMVDPIFSLSLSLAHCAVIVWILPLYLAIGVVATTFLGIIIAFRWSFALFASLCPLFLAVPSALAMLIYFKAKVGKLARQYIYLKDQAKIRASYELNASLYEDALGPLHATSTKRDGSILIQVVRKVEESIPFLDNHTPIYKKDLQTIIHKFHDWIYYFNSRETANAHTLLQPTQITLDKLIGTIEVTLSQKIDHPPKLLVEKEKTPSNQLNTDIICDIDQITYALGKAILRIGKHAETIPPIVNVALHPTTLQVKQDDAIDNSGPVYMDFQAIALVISLATFDPDNLPKVKKCYEDYMDPKKEKEDPPSIDLEQDTLSSVVRAHYGYLEASFDQKPTMLMVLPINVSDILDKMTAKLPIDSLTIEAPATPKEQADSMIKLMQFHDHICTSLCKRDSIDVKTILDILLLLRKHFGFKRHVSGQLFYVRAVAIAELVVDWTFHSPKAVYAALLYELVRHTCLPLSYVKEHYNLGVYAFVSNLIKIDKREALKHPSLLYVQHRLAQAIKEEHLHLSVLFIKLAERLYDLRHAAGYIYLTEMKHMAQETLNIDVQIANIYLDPAIGQALEKAAKEALELFI